MYLKEAFEKANVGDEICRNGTHHGFKKQEGESFGFFVERLSKMGWSIHGLLSDQWEVIPQRKRRWINIYWSDKEQGFMYDTYVNSFDAQAGYALRINDNKIYRRIKTIEVEIPQ